MPFHREGSSNNTNKSELPRFPFPTSAPFLSSSLLSVVNNRRNIHLVLSLLRLLVKVGRDLRQWSRGGRGSVSCPCRGAGHVSSSRHHNTNKRIANKQVSQQVKGLGEKPPLQRRFRDTELSPWAWRRAFLATALPGAWASARTPWEISRLVVSSPLATPPPL